VCWCVIFYFACSRFEKEKRRIENLKKAAAEKVKEEERERKFSKFPSNVIINEKALKNQPIVKYQVGITPIT